MIYDRVRCKMEMNTKDLIDLTEIVTLDAKNLDKSVVKTLTEHIATEIMNLNDYDITSMNVVATANPTYKTQNYSITIVATAYGHSYVVEKISEKCIKISDLYASAQSQLKHNLIQYRNRVKQSITK